MSWLPMTERDMDDVVAIAEIVHLGFPEDRAVLAEKLALHPEGCFMLRDGEAGATLGYLLSHPWQAGSAPPLDTLLHTLPEPELYYIHDIALLPAARGRRAGEKAVEAVEAHARALGFNRIALVAVNGSTGFWQRHGFTIVDDAGSSEKLATYGPDAVYMTKRLKT